MYIYIPPGNRGWHIILSPSLVFGTFLRMSCLVSVFGWDMFSRFLQHIATNVGVALCAPFGRVHACLQEAYVPPAPQSRPEVCDFVHGDRSAQLAAWYTMKYKDIKQLWFSRPQDEISMRMRMIYDDIIFQIVGTKWTRTCLLLHVSSRCSSLESVENILPTVWQKYSFYWEDTSDTSIVHPRKIHMDHNDGGLEDHVPFQMGDL